MPRFRAVWAAGAVLVLTCSPSEATSFSFLVKAIREHQTNPTPETQARLVMAQVGAAAIQYGVPIGAVGGTLYILLRRRKQ